MNGEVMKLRVVTLKIVCLIFNQIEEYALSRYNTNTNGAYIYTKACCFVIVFDVNGTSENAVTSLNFWLKGIKQNTDNSIEIPLVVLGNFIHEFLKQIIGNKTDKQKKNDDITKEIERWCTINNATFFKTSALNTQETEEVFSGICQIIKKHKSEDTR